MDLVGYLVVFAAVFAVNLLPAFGPPTWAVLVLFSLHGDYLPAVLIAVGALAAASGRLLLATGTRKLGEHVPSKQRENLKAAGELVGQRRSRTFAFLALFAVSPLPSAQLFEAAGLMSVRLLPLTAAFFSGRLVSYTFYVVSASTLKETDTGQVLLSHLTSPWAIAIEVVLLSLLVLLARVDWRRLGARQSSTTAA